MKKFNFNQSLKSFALLASSFALAASFSSCNKGGNTPEDNSGIQITSVTTNSTYTSNLYSNSGQVSLIVNISDSKLGSNSLSITASSTQITADQKQIGNYVYEVQTRCETSACTGVAFLIIARTGVLNSQSTYGNYFGTTTSTINGNSVVYQNSSGQFTMTSSPIYSHEFLYRLNASNVWQRVKQLNDSTGQVTVLDQTQITALQTIGNG